MKMPIAKKKAAFRTMDIYDLLKQQFKADKTVVKCVEEGEYNFTLDKHYKIYLSQPNPRIYDDESNCINIHEVDDDDFDELPEFEINVNHIKDGNGDDKLINIEEKLTPRKQEPVNTTGLAVSKENVMKRVINRLNGIQLAEESLVELRQDTAERRDVNIDLVSLLSSCPQIKEMKLGENAILEKLDIKGDNMVLQVSKGTVTREENSAVLKAIQTMVKDTSQ